MSRPDTSLLFKFPQIDRREQDLQEAQKQALIAERGAQVQSQLAQAEFRKREADKLRQQNEETRLTYNARHAVDDVLQKNSNATIAEQMTAGGVYALPYITERATALSKQAEADLRQHTAHAQYVDWAGNAALGLSKLPADQRPKAFQEAIQREMQPGGQIDLWAKNTGQDPQAIANQLLQSGTDDETLQREIAMTPALKVQIDENRQKAKDALDEQVKNAQIAASQATTASRGAQQAQAEATTKKTNSETERIERGETPVPTAPKTPVPGVDVPFSKDVEAQKIRMKAQEASQGEAAVQLSPAGLDVAADMFAKTGQLPPMGMGKAGASVRSKIINRAAERNPNLDLATNKAEFKANETSLTALQKNRDAVVAFENTASKNLDLFVTQAQKVVDSGSPWINQPLRAVQQRGLGSADLAAFNTARQVAINEIAKVTSSPGLSGTLSDSARHEVEAFIPENATLAQVLAVAKTLRADMKNRHESLDEQIGAIQKRIGSGGKDGGGGKRAGTVIDPAGGEHNVSDVDAAIKLHPGTKEKK